LPKLKPFDAAIQAHATLKERFVWLVFMGILFFLLYGASNEYAYLTSPHPAFFWQWEVHIPFISALIVPYMSSDIVFVIAFLLVQTRFELRVLALRVLFIILLSVLIFGLFPLQFSFEKPFVDGFSFLFTLLEADKPFNQLPSLHVSFAIVFWHSMKAHITNKLLKLCLGLWLVLVALSTLFVFQHHFIDLPTGALVGLLAVYLFKEGRNQRLLTAFTTPRHIKMGLYFLFGSIVLMVFTFIAHSLTIPLLPYLLVYLFICTLSVSVIYTFGFNHLLANAKGDVNSLQWIVFFPYFIGCTLSWAYYARTLPLSAKIAQGVFIGRHPKSVEYSKIKALGVNHVINLAIELQLNKTILASNKLILHRLNFLDQTIQSPDALHQAVQLIERYKEQGVYVHCALGLSRSILVCWAWMMFNGKSDEEIINHLTEVRPRFVQSQYMQINVDLYREFLAANKLLLVS
jgi:protein-tyrosine phosphatase/membrane-associated phospholipid phosphatase